MFDETMQVQLLFKISGVGNTEHHSAPCSHVNQPIITPTCVENITLKKQMRG